jgi:adenylosuccinate synthase
MTFVGMSGLSHRFIGSVMVNMRTFPIRVGDGPNNKVDGFSGVSLEGSNSGDHYPDQREVTWDYVTEYSGSMEPICEMTSLTKRVRRVFTFSDMQWHRASMVTGPNLITINYVNYLDSSISGKHGVWDLSSLETMFPKVWQFVMRIRAGRFWTNPVRIWLGTGPANSEVIELDGVYE